MLVAETVLAIAISGARKPRNAGEDSWVIFNSVQTPICLKSDSRPSIYGAVDSIETALSKDFGLLREVSYVLVEKTSEGLMIWIASDDVSKPVRRQIYAKQLAMFDAFPEAEFDFNIIQTDGRNPDEIVSGASLYYAR